MKKNKIIDLVFYFNEREMLHKRLSYLSDIVDITIIVNYGKKINKNYGDNVYQINIDEPYNLKTNKVFEKIISIFGEKYFKYYDNFIFSKVFEIPSIECLHNEISKIESEPNYIFQKKLMWDRFHKSCVYHPGPVLFKYNQLQISKDILNYFEACKSDLTQMGIKNTCGWNLQLIQDNDEILKSIKFWYGIDIPYNDLKFYRESLCEPYPKNIGVEENEFDDLPKKFYGLSQKYPLRQPLDVLITNNLELLHNSKNDIKVLFTNADIKSSEFIVNDVNVPSRVLYGDKDYNDFVEDYKFNNLLFVLKDKCLMNNDRINIKIKSESIDSDFTITYEEFKNSIPSELIRTSSSSQTFLKSLFVRLLPQRFR